MSGVRDRLGRLPLRRYGILGAIVGLSAVVAIVVPAPAAGAVEKGAQTAKQTRALWTGVAGTPRPARTGARPAIKPDRFRSFRLNRTGLRSALARAGSGLVVSLPAPGGGFQRFALELSPMMEPALARRHPTIKTFAGRGLDDPAATIRADIGPLGFHASVRSPKGSWYIDPYYLNDQSLYVSYYGRDLDNVHGVFVEREGDESEADAFAAELAETLDVPEGPLVTLRTYRLALLSDPTYATYFGGPANVTAAKVTLVNRVNQIYEDETAVRMVLVGNNDLINLDTPAQMTGANGPCGSAPCYTQAQATSCGGATLTRTRIVIGQLIGASNYDVGHIGLGNPGGGVASLGVVGGNNKAQGCTGLSTPVGDFFAVDYVAHEIGHQFAGNHTFNGTQSNCSGGNRSAANSVEPGSGSSIMAYAGICQQDNLQPHSDPYWSFRSFQEITALVTGDRPPINEVQNVSLTDFSGGNETQTFQLTGFGGTDSFQLAYLGNLSAPIVNGTNYSAAGVAAAIEGIAGWPVGATLTVTGIGGAAFGTAGFDVTFGGTLANTDVATFAVVNGVGATGIVSTPFNGGPTFDSFRLSHDGATTAPIVSDSNYTAAGIAEALQGPSEVQTVTLDGYDADGDSYTLNYGGADTHAIVRGQNNTAAGIQNALQGGNEQQQAILTGFDGATQSFQVDIGGNLSAVLGFGGLAISNANVAAAVNAIAGFAGTVTSANSGNGGFTLTFAGASANVDVPSISIVNCTGGCASSVRELAKGGTGAAGWPVGGTVAVGSLTDAGYTLTFSGAHQGTDVSAVAVTNGVGVTGSVAETVKGSPGIIPIGATATVAPFGAAGIFNDFGFQVTFGGVLGLMNTSQLALTDVNGFSGHVGETAKGGPVDNKGWIITPTGNHSPTVTTATQYTIPTRTPFALTGSATDFDGDSLTYIWEQTDRGGAAGTALVNNTKANGPLFRQFGTAANVSPSDTLLTPSPGLNAVGTDPTRVFPDLAQILVNNTNAVTGACPAAPPAPTALPPDIRDCFSEFLPTNAWVGFLNDRTLNFKLTARDGNPGAGGVGAADTRLVIDPLAGPFLVTSQSTSAPVTGGSTQTVTWDVAGTNVAPIGVTEVKISLSVDGGTTYPYVLAAATANDGSEPVNLPNDGTTTARIKVEAVGNVFFDISETNFTIQAVPVVTTFDRSLQYSDGLGGAVVSSATDEDSEGSTLSAVATGVPAGLTLAVSSTSGAGVLPGSRTWTLAGNVTAAPGSYPVSVTVTDGTGASTTASFTVTVTQEDAAAVYVGDAIAFAGPGGSAASVLLLRATVRDSSIVASSGDAAPGDIRNATVTFRQGATTLCGPVPVQLLNGTTTTGAANCFASLGPGVHTVDVVVSSYYTGTSSASARVLNPAATTAPNASHVDGQGNITVGQSAGTHRADTGSRLSFELDVKFNTATGPTGNVEINYNGGGKAYRIRSDDIDSLGAFAGNADIRATSSLTDITNRRRPIVVADSLTLRLTADGDDPDAIGITLWAGDRLVLSSRWTGWSTLEQTLAGGRIDVR